MKVLKSAIMAALLSMSVPESADADAGFAHVLPSIVVARPCGATDTCSYTWSTATRLGDMLAFAERRYGPRDPSWTLLGVEFAAVRAPQVWYPNFGAGHQTIVVQITESAARDEKKALFQMSHEVVHVLSPLGPGGKASMLEEGLATYNSIDYLRAAGFDISPSYVSAESYEAAYWLIIELEAVQPDFADRIKAMRSTGKKLSSLSAAELRSAMPGLSTALANRLVAEF